MNILITFIVTSIISGILGFMISIVSKYFFVEEDDLLSEVTNMLPGYNCGACGYPGCKKLAQKIIESNDQVYKCKPLKEEQRQRILDFIKNR